MKKIKLTISFLLISIINLHYGLAQVYEPVSAKNGIVVSTDPISSNVGIEVLKDGGNAMDAAIATAFSLAVTYQSCGNIGGGGFLTYYSRKSGEITTIDFRITAPLSSNKEMYSKNGKIDYSLFNTIQASGVPGTVAGLELAHKKYGSLPWSRLVEPSVKLAKDGFPMHLKLYNEIKNEKKYLLQYPSTIKTYLKPDSSFYEIGEMIKQPDLAKTLRRIQKKGASDFYQGETAQMIEQFMKNNNGFITLEDLKIYKALEKEPVIGKYKDYEIYSMAPPSSGGIIIIESLNMLENFNVKELGHNSAAYIQLLYNVFKKAYKDREKYIGDPDFVKNIPVKKLISEDYALQCIKEIGIQNTTKSKYNDNPDNEKKETTHFSMIDKEGNAVSLTYTLDGDFGSYGIVEGAGFFLNNEVQAFDYKNEQNPNFIEPGKRPLSSMSPTIIMKDRKVKYVIGTPGGRAIPSALIQIILNLIEFDMNLAEAISAKRIFTSWWSNEICIEKGGITKDTKILLEKLGYKVDLTDWRICNAMCIEVDKEKSLYYGAADPRSLNGLAIGY